MYLLVVTKAHFPLGEFNILAMVVFIIHLSAPGLEGDSTIHKHLLLRAAKQHLSFDSHCKIVSPASHSMRDDRDPFNLWINSVSDESPNNHMFKDRTIPTLTGGHLFGFYWIIYKGCFTMSV